MVELVIKILEIIAIMITIMWVSGVIYMNNHDQYAKGYEDGKNDVLDKIKVEIMDTGSYEQEINGKTEFLKGINYCLDIIDKYKSKNESQESEE